MRGRKEGEHMKRDKQGTGEYGKSGGEPERLKKEYLWHDCVMDFFSAGCDDDVMRGANKIVQGQSMVV